VIEREGEDEEQARGFIRVKNGWFLSRRADGSRLRCKAPPALGTSACGRRNHRCRSERTGAKAQDKSDVGGDVTDQAAPAVEASSLTIAPVGASPLSTATNLLSDFNGVSARFIAPIEANPFPTSSMRTPCPPA
jgi:hypothetical protein